MLADRLGRRKLLMGGTMAMIAALVGLAVAFADKDAPMPSLALASLLVFILGWDVSWAGLMLAVVAEVLPLAVRGAGTGLAYSLYWVVSFVTAQFLETAMHSLGTSQTFGGIGVVTSLGCSGPRRACPRRPTRRSRRWPSSSGARLAQHPSRLRPRCRSTSDGCGGRREGRAATRQARNANLSVL